MKPTVELTPEEVTPQDALRELVDGYLDTIGPAGPDGAWAGEGWYAYDSAAPEDGSLYLGSSADVAALLALAVRALAERES